MRVLLDNCVDIGFRSLIIGHEVSHALDMGWADLSNGRLIAACEDQGYQALITVDKGLRHQQSLSGKQLSIITLAPRFVTLEYIAPLIPLVQEALSDLRPGSFVSIEP